MNDSISRRDFNRLFGAIFAMLCGVKIEPAAALEPKDNTSYWPDRILPIPEYPHWNVWEQAFAAVWVKENARNPGRNQGHGLLQDLMISTYQHEVKRKGKIKPEDFDVWISDRERKICATLIQWLGTNCGRSFLWEVQREAVRRFELGKADKWQRSSIC